MMDRCQDVYHENEAGDPTDYDTIIDCDGIRRCWGCVEDAEYAYNELQGELADIA